jgi:hypothetical protein
MTSKSDDVSSSSTSEATEKSVEVSAKTKTEATNDSGTLTENVPPAQSSTR